MKRTVCIFSALLIFAIGAAAQYRADKLVNRPYADNRRWHLGFSVGMHVQDLQFTNSGAVSEDGREWYVEQPGFSPGFCVNGLVDFRLNNYFALRISPGLYFGNRNLRFRDAVTGDEERQNLKSTFVVVPVDIKFSALRYHNVRPYVSAGVMPAFDVTKRQRDFIQLTNSDVYLTFGIGCDTYLPFFKFIPEVKFCFGLKDVLRHDRPDLVDDPGAMQFTKALRKAVSRMVVLTFYFE